MSTAGDRGRAGEPIKRLAVELAVFAALATFGLAQWGRLFASPPHGRLAAVLAVVLVGALALALLGRTRLAGPPRIALGLVVAVATAVAGLLVAGLPLRLLAPAGWSELAGKLGDGLGGIEDTVLPYDGEQVWPRLTLLFAAPLLLSVAATLAFWPSPRRATLRTLALVFLVGLYAVAVTLDSPGSELLWGIPLLLLVVAWLWLPGLPLRRAAVGLAVAALAGFGAVPIAFALDPDRPWLDYENWDWFAGEREISFEWNHNYGPLDWPQRGTTLFAVESGQPLYWKTSVLDRFDGFTWQRASPDDALAAAEVRVRGAAPTTAALARRNPEWVLPASFRIGALESDLLVGAGVPLTVRGIEGVVGSADGTVSLADGPIGSGDDYAIEAYAPQPSPRRMRAAPAGSGRGGVSDTTLLGLPASTPDLGPSGFSPSEPIRVPAWGRPAGAAGRALEASEYAASFALAQRLTADAPTMYDAVLAVQDYLRRNYDYTPNAEQHTYPLAAFLFSERAGYCQHFAGSMALLLRMVGIPARVVAGFAPGAYEPGPAAYVVRDTDAHSWVEVYFRGIGWVSFDPTPSAAPAAAQALEAGGPVVLRRDGTTLGQGLGRREDIEQAAEGGRLPRIGAASDGSSAVPLVFAGLLGATVVAAAVGFTRRRRRLASSEAGELLSQELLGALERLGWEVEPGATLFAIERRFETAGRRPIAAYAAGLRRHRFAPRATGKPDAAQRRKLRAALAKGGGIRRRLRALAAIPPGGPRASATRR